MRRLRRLIFGISPAEAGFARRGFRGGDAAARAHIERIGKTFIAAYLMAVEEGGPDRLFSQLAAVAAEYRGFAYEGAAMGLALLDRIIPWPWRRDRLERFLAGPGAEHVYMLNVGAGWAAARLPFPLATTLRRLDPLLGWLAVDGYGFHEGYFRWPRAVSRQLVPRRLTGYQRRAFDQGLGRSLWFIEGSEVSRIAATVAGFPEPRRPDLWSGVGLACVYAGVIETDAIEALVAAAGPYRCQLAQGAAFAAQARLLPGLAREYTELACQVICGCSAAAAAAITEDTLHDLPRQSQSQSQPAYEVWRTRIQDRFANFSARR